MAFSSVSHVSLPYAQCSSGPPRQRILHTCHSGDLQFLTRRSSYRVRQCVRLSKSIIAVQNSENSSGYSRVRIEASNSENSAENSRVSSEASTSENSSENSRVSNESSTYMARRTYRKPLASLRVTGEALPLQVHAALAADGGRTAAQELAKGKPMLVIETYNPGRFSEGSSVSTKLQAPTLSVLKKAKSMPKNDSQFSPIGRVFAIAFQAVRLLKLSKFELCFFKPGTMDDYKDGEVVGFVEVFDASTLSELAKGVSSYALACVRDLADQRMKTDGFGFRKVKPMTTVDSSAVRISTLTNSEVLAHVETIIEEKTLVGASVGLRQQRSWWERPVATQSVVMTGVDAQLVDEFVPAHALVFKLPSKSFEAVGLQKTSETSCRIDLTHAQMMDLADVLDLYCGDPYTGPGENFSISIDIPRRSWSQAVAVGALASVFGGALLLGILSMRRARGQMEIPAAVESIFDRAFSQKLRELREGEPVDDEQTDPVDGAVAAAQPTETANDEAGYESLDEADLAEQNDEPVYKSSANVSFRGRTR